MSRFLNYPQAFDIFSLIKNYVDDHTPDDVVYSVSLNGGPIVRPDSGGNVDLTIPTPDMSNYVARADTIWLQTLYGKENWAFGMLIGDSKTDPLVTKSYVDAKVPDLTGIIKTISYNNGTRVGPDASGNANLTIPTYTLELDGGSEANITASIDGGDPVSKDSNDNINLDIPDKYISTFYGWGRQFDNTSKPKYNDEGEPIPHTVDIGFIGKPRYYLDMTAKPAFISTRIPSFHVIKMPSGAVIELFGLDNEYCKLGSRGVMSVAGDMFVGRVNYGSLGDCFLIGCAKSVTMNIMSLSHYDYIRVLTGFDDNDEPTYDLYNYNVWEKTIVVKGLDAAGIKKYIIDKDSKINWIYKPVYSNQYVSDDVNTNIPGMYWDIMGGFSASNLNDNYVYLNWHNDPNFGAGHWKFYDCYEGGMVGDDGVAKDWTFRMPYYPNYSFREGADQYILLDFALTNTSKSRINKDFRCVIEDPAGNILFDVKMKAFNAQSSALTIAGDNRIHIYKRLKYNAYQKVFDVYENACW